VKVRTDIDEVDYNTIQEVGINIGIYKKVLVLLDLQFIELCRDIR